MTQQLKSLNVWALSLALAGTATVAGETMVVLAGASNAGLLRSGQLRGLATTGRKRSPMSMRCSRM